MAGISFADDLDSSWEAAASDSVTAVASRFGPSKGNLFELCQSHIGEDQACHSLCLEAVKLEAVSSPLRPLNAPVSMRSLLQKLQAVDAASAFLPQPDAPKNAPTIWAISDIPISASAECWHLHLEDFSESHHGHLVSRFWMLSHIWFSACRCHHRLLQWLDGPQKIFVHVAPHKGSVHAGLLLQTLPHMDLTPFWLEEAQSLLSDLLSPLF